MGLYDYDFALRSEHEETVRRLQRERDEQRSVIDGLRDEVRHVAEQRDRLQQRVGDQHARIAEIETLLREVKQIADDSTGVAGWHRNGDVAEWSEFTVIDLIALTLSRSAQ